MRFVVDECTGPRVAAWLRQKSHDVYSVYEQSRGMDDASVLAKAFSENRILITNDRDFGELVFRDSKPHKGVIFLRLEDERAESKIDALEKLLAVHSEVLSNAFVVVTETQIRFASIK